MRRAKYVKEQHLRGLNEGEYPIYRVLLKTPYFKNVIWYNKEAWEKKNPLLDSGKKYDFSFEWRNKTYYLEVELKTKRIYNAGYTTEDYIAWEGIKFQATKVDEAIAEGRENGLYGILFEGRIYLRHYNFIKNNAHDPKTKEVTKKSYEKWSESRQAWEYFYFVFKDKCLLWGEIDASG